MFRYYHILLPIFLIWGCTSSEKRCVSSYQDEGRPQIHYSPDSMWMNDPNGMVYDGEQYHLFYQYYPYDIQWGPMHWGHAVSDNLIEWEHRPIALFPDSLGCIFSGSAVIDYHNTSGFGVDGKAPMVLIYTNHDMLGARPSYDCEWQSIAYSNDNGQTFTKYEGNPVLRGEGHTDIRDPKVIWHASSERWIMTLATGDCVSFYTSPNLKEWSFASKFGKQTYEHAGVWECPDLFPITYLSKEYWVLLVSMNNGAPNGGSGTFYFVGTFDGSHFIPQGNQPVTQWLDYGTDNYAAVTYSGIPVRDGRRIMMGWMNNWRYAESLPTKSFRSAMTLPRSLTLQPNSYGAYELKYEVIKEIENLAEEWKSLLTTTTNVLRSVDAMHAYELELVMDASATTSTTLTLSNDLDQQVTLVLYSQRGYISIDRSQSGNTEFSSHFENLIQVPYHPLTETTLRLYIDTSSIELFINDGTRQASVLIFPSELLRNVALSSEDPIILKSAKARALRSIWCK